MPRYDISEIRVKTADILKDPELLFDNTQYHRNIQRAAANLCDHQYYSLVYRCQYESGTTLWENVMTGTTYLVTIEGKIQRPIQ